MITFSGTFSVKTDMQLHFPHVLIVDLPRFTAVGEESGRVVHQQFKGGYSI